MVSLTRIARSLSFRFPSRAYECARSQTAITVGSCNAECDLTSNYYLRREFHCTATEYMLFHLRTSTRLVRPRFRATKFQLLLYLLHGARYSTFRTSDGADASSSPTHFRCGSIPRRR